jgi:FkbM family methyltransferase
MNYKYLLKQIFEKLSGAIIYRKLPFGLNPLYDLQNGIYNYQINIFFDVGANIGQTVNAIKKAYPKGKIYCFEPFEVTFYNLKKNTENFSNIEYFQFAFGAKQEIIEIDVDMNKLTFVQNSLVNNNKYINAHDIKKERIKVQTLNEFCRLKSIEKIDYLKIDTEGYDLEVLKGGNELLENMAISFIEIELGMNPENNFHVDFCLVKKFLENYGYRIFGIYEQRQEWMTSTPILRRINALFISLNAYTKTK